MQNVFCIKVVRSVPNIECHSVYTTQSEFIPKSESEQVDSELTSSEHLRWIFESYHIELENVENVENNVIKLDSGHWTP